MLVLFVRYVASFASVWFANILSRQYERELKEDLFSRALNTEVTVRNDKESDTLLSSIVTETNQVGSLVIGVLAIFRIGTVSLAYLFITLSINAWLAIATMATAR